MSNGCNLPDLLRSQMFLENARNGRVKIILSDWQVFIQFMMWIVNCRVFENWRLYWINLEILMQGILLLVNTAR